MIAEIYFSVPIHRTAMARGKLLHSCFELVTWLDQSVPTESQLDAQLRKD